MAASEPESERERLARIAWTVWSGLPKRDALPSYLEFRRRVLFAYPICRGGLVLVRDRVAPNVAWVYWYGRGFCPRPLTLKRICLLAWLFGIDWLACDIQDSNKPDVSARIAEAAGFGAVGLWTYGLRLNAA